MPSSMVVFLFAVLLSLHLHTLLIFFALVYLIFVAAYLIAFTLHTVHNFALYACAQMKKMASQMKPYLLSERFQAPHETLKLSKSDGVMHCPCKMLLFCANRVVRESTKFERF